MPLLSFFVDLLSVSYLKNVLGCWNLISVDGFSLQYSNLVVLSVGIALPKHWTPMPGHDSTVHRVLLPPGSPEYQDVVRKFQATAGALNIQKIERIQNPHLYQSYMVRKQKMDKDTGGNSERQLFHGTVAKNVNNINTQGFNRSFCGANGKSLKPYIVLSRGRD